MGAINVDGRIIGKIHGRASEDGSQIFGFRMQAGERGQGHGKAALSLAVAELLQTRRQKLVLEVATGNDRALGTGCSTASRSATAPEP